MSIDTKNNTFDYTAQKRGRSRFCDCTFAAPICSGAHTTSDEYRGFVLQNKRSAHEDDDSLPVSSLGMSGLLLHYTIFIHDQCSVKQKDNIRVQTW